MIAAMTIEGLLATDAPFAADLQALRPQPGQAVSAANLRTMLAGSPIVASHATPDDTTGAGRVLDPLHAVGARRGARHAGPLPPRRRERTRLGDRQPDGAPGRSGRIVRQLPRRPARVRRRLPGHRRRRDRRDRRTTDGSDARHDAQPRPPAVPRRRGRRRQRHDDRPLHRGGHGLGEQAARRARVGRLAPDVGDAGGPRVDGMARGRASSARSSTTFVGSSPSSTCVRHGRSTSALRSFRRRRQAPCETCCAATCRDPGPTATSPRNSRRPKRCSRRRTCQPR